MSENYLRDLNDSEGIVQCYQEYGAVGVTGILNSEELHETHTDIEHLIRDLGPGDSFILNDYNTHHLADKYLNAHGTIGSYSLMTPILMRNRLHKNVRKAFSTVYNLPEEQLLAQYDRVAWMRATVGPNCEDWSMYRTPYNKPGLHLDVDPRGYCDPQNKSLNLDYLNNIPYDSIKSLVQENNVRNVEMGIQLQGVLNLFDNKEEDGGFHFYPGGHHKLREWFERREHALPEASANGRHIFTPMDYEFNYSQRLPCPAGTLIIFDAALPHGTKPNFSNNQRMIQFLRYMPKSNLGNKTYKKRKDYILKICKDINYNVTEDEMKVI